MRRPASLLLLLFACSQPPPQPAPEASKPVPEASHPTPAATPPPPAPASDVAWWCTCYTRSGAIPVTSCRKTQADCRRIEQQALEGGGSAIVPGSLTHRCRELRGEHPGDVLGGRDGWQPIAKSGSWVSQGACLLPGPADAPPPPAPKDTHDDERLGGLALGMTDAAVRDLLGEPAGRGKPVQPKDGPYRLAWQYPDRGLALEFTGAANTGPWQLDSVLAKSPCDLRTSRGVGLGDPRSNVDAAYLKDNPFPMRSNATSYIAAGPAHTVRFEFDPKSYALVMLHLSRRRD